MRWAKRGFRRSAPAMRSTTVTSTPTTIVMRRLFHSHRFREVARLVDVASALDGDVIREELQRDDIDERREHFRAARYRNRRRESCVERILALGDERDDRRV